jgi:hypothetical protein
MSRAGESTRISGRSVSNAWGIVLGLVSFGAASESGDMDLNVAGRFELEWKLKHAKLPSGDLDLTLSENFGLKWKLKV